IGDLNALARPQTLDRHVEAELTDVPVDVAIEALRGMLLGALNNDTVIGSDTNRLEPAQRAESLFSTRELALALRNKALHKITKSTPISEQRSISFPLSSRSHTWSRIRHPSV